MPNWKHKLPLKDIWEAAKNAGVSYSEVGKQVAARIREQPWAQNCSGLDKICKAFCTVTNIEQFDDTMGSLYNWADYDRFCWVETF